MTILEAKKQLLHSLLNIYDSRESGAIADLVLENITGLTRIDRVIHKNEMLSPEKTALLEKYTGELIGHKPIQYVLEEAWFSGMKFYVNEYVLIPRPETEELVHWLIEDAENEKNKNQYPISKSKNILDVGTGSGCIAISLKKKLLQTEIVACDISQYALEVAKRNAMLLGTTINFLQLDFLKNNTTDALSVFDYIISNPPYIPLKDKITMKQHVVEYEPHQALFVPDADPLVFYRAIANFAVRKLSADGKIFVELHEELATSVAQLFLSLGFKATEIKKDIQGKDRMMKITR